MCWYSWVIKNCVKWHSFTVLNNIVFLFCRGLMASLERLHHLNQINTNSISLTCCFICNKKIWHGLCLCSFSTHGTRYQELLLFRKKCTFFGNSFFTGLGRVKTRTCVVISSNRIIQDGIAKDIRTGAFLMLFTSPKTVNSIIPKGTLSRGIF